MASSLSPPKVPMGLHVGNRQKLLESFRHHLSLGFVLLQGGEEQTRYNTDHLELFGQESYFAYLFRVREPGFYGAIVSSFHLAHFSTLADYILCVARFLESRGMIEDSVEVASDPDYRFDLAIHFGKLEVAKSIAREVQSESLNGSSWAN
ncbi:hypothetical protein PIB30_020792 [Stylosanthes scabra]|uniref:Uncharacterized protein n=1 Tax=Stylosanthes scabra TaxID=79078 RepID=A0ABU6R8Y3_9FABA|nr:hypothetical protein [Stylosanthes scabra]